MTDDHEFRQKLNALPSSIAPGGRAQVRELIASVVNAGGVSVGALVNMVLDSARSLHLRLDICWLLPRLNIAGAADVLKQLLSDPSDEMRTEAAASLGLVLKDGDLGVLHDSLAHDPNRLVRAAALHSLGIISSPESADAIIGILEDETEDEELRAEAAEALAHVRIEGVVNVLMHALQDNSSAVRYSAAYALGEQGDKRALPVLREVALHDHATTEWGTVASRAAESIGILSGRRD